MVLNHYWWLLIWILAFGAVSYAAIPQREETVLGRSCVRWRPLPAFLLALPYVLWAAWRVDSIGDTGVYRAMFLAAPAELSQLGRFLASETKGRGYAVIEVLFKSLISGSDRAFFLLIAAIQIFCLVTVYRKYSRNYWLSMFLFVASTDYLSWMHNGIRQFLAVTVLFTCLPLLIKKKYFPLVLIVALLSQIHLSAWVFLPFIFIVQGKPWNWRTLLFLAAVTVSVVLVDEFTGFVTSAMENTAYEGDIELFVTDDGTSILRVLFYSLPAMLSLAFRRYIEAADDPLINACTNLSVITAGFYVISFFTSGLLVGRLPIFFSLSNYILIPWLLTEVFTPRSARLLQACFVGVYSYFFYYQVFVTWGLF